MVEDYAFIVDSKLYIGKVQRVFCSVWEFFPVANCVIRDVTYCSADKPEFVVANCLVFNETFDYGQGVTGFFLVFFPCSFVASCCCAILYLDGYFRVESDEGVLCQFFWSFDRFEKVSVFSVLIEF